MVVIDGPSSVGKSTTVAALQEDWPRVGTGPLLDVGLDQTLGSLGSATLPRWWDLIHSYDPSHDEPFERVTWGPLGRELIGVMHRAAALWARAGFDVVVEHVLLDRITATDLAASLDGLPVLHVGLTCDPDVLEDRERDHLGLAGIAPGGALAELAATQDVAVRDLLLDTTEMATEEIVDAILEELVRRRVR